MMRVRIVFLKKWNETKLILKDWTSESSMCEADLVKTEYSIESKTMPFLHTQNLWKFDLTKVDYYTIYKIVKICESSSFCIVLQLPHHVHQELISAIILASIC